MLPRRLTQFPCCLLIGLSLFVYSAGHGTSECLGQNVPKSSLDFFEAKIRPVLVESCFACHSESAEIVEGDLKLDSQNGIQRGGESGPLFDFESANESLIISALRYDGLEMPPDHPLSEGSILDFIHWIELGAPTPDSYRARESSGDPNLADQHWSFQSREQVAIPVVSDSDWATDPIDRFVLSRIESRGLSPADVASPRTLIQRLYFDLVGLAPSYEAIERFEQDYQSSGTHAYERLVDSLLARPQFGERWGRHWLDVARYGESNGDDGLGRNATFPHAWRYRDYVIDSFNRDSPYDRFLVEQIAGDLLPASNADQRNRNLVATGFLAIGAKPAAAMNQNFAMDIVDDQINVVSTAVMGLSVACARCHDHKHDPVSMQDYYALAGIFTSTETLYGAAANEALTAPATPLHELKEEWSSEEASRPTNQTPSFAEGYTEVIQSFEPEVSSPLQELPEFLTVESGVTFSNEQFAVCTSATMVGEVESATDEYSVSFWFKNETGNQARPITAYLFSRGQSNQGQLRGDHLGIGGAHRADSTGKLFVFNGNESKQSVIGKTTIDPNSWNHVVLIRKENRVSLFLNGAIEPEIDAELPSTINGATQYTLGSRSDQFAPLAGQLAEFAFFSRPIETDVAQRLHEASGQPRAVPTIGYAMGVRERSEPADCKVHNNGNVNELGDVVARGVPSAFSNSDIVPTGPFVDFEIADGSSGRRQLAEWLTHPDHPQTARVMVNRVWLKLMGNALVSSPNDFGVYGSRPTDRHLIDHLAQRLVDHQWSIKHLIRDIVLSRTYQLDSQAPQELLMADPENHLFARQQRRRLDAESLRDRLLQVSGQLDLNPAKGSDIEQVDALLNWPPGEASNLHQPSHHRSVYLCMLRNAPPSELSAFDLPDGIAVTSQRERTTLPTHGLYLMNSPFVLEQSRALGMRLVGRPEEDTNDRIVFVFKQILQRSPTDQEIELGRDYLEFLYETDRTRVVDVDNRREDFEIAIWSSFCHAILATNEFRYVD